MEALITINNQEFNLDKEKETLLATQEQIANIFNTTRANITIHIKNIFKEKELEEISVCKEILLTASDGKKYQVKHYNLDVIIAVGYRVNSLIATKFRIQATQVIKEYLTTGEVKKKEYSKLEIARMLVESELEKEKLLTENQEHKQTIENQDKTINQISNIQDTYSIREASKNLIVKEMNLKDFLKTKKWIQYLSDGTESKKIYSTSYSKQNNFAIDKHVLNKANQKFYHQFRITKHGMSYLIKNRKEI
jgi:hypothetical protein